MYYFDKLRIYLYVLNENIWITFVLIISQKSNLLFKNIFLELLK
jgi:hypothetical protein